MSIREILGADDFPAGTRYPTYQLLGKGVLPSTNQGVSSANTSIATLNGRNWLRVTGIAAPSVTSLLSAAKITVAEMKTKKIYGGFRYCVPNNNLTKTTDPILRIVFTGPGAAYSLLLENDLQRTTDEVYIKYMIDVANLTASVWVDGTFIRSQVLGANVPTLTDIQMIYGQNSTASTVENHHYNDFYWEVDTFDVDGIQAGKLGPVKAKSAKVSGTVLAAGWSVSDGSNPDTVLDTLGLAPNTELTPTVRTSPDESVSSIGFAKPSAELAIKAVSIEVFAYRDTGTAPSLQAQLKQGTTLDTKKTFTVPTNDFNRGAVSDRIGCFNVDLNGQAWTNDSIDALTLLVNSKTGA
ncbi:hypothetical protein D3C87_598380 [compost metagenome]